MSVTDQSRATSPLADTQYRNDLIHSAVTTFAPHLASRSDLRVIHLYSTNNALRRLVRDTFKSAKTLIVEHVGPEQDRVGVNAIQYHQPFLPLPPCADLVIGKARPSRDAERLAACLGTYVAVLPAAEDYIRNMLDKRIALVLVGDDQGKA